MKMKLAPAVILAIMLLGTNTVLLHAQQNWLFQATIAGTEMDNQMTDREIFDKLDSLKAQRITVLEVESRLADFLTEAELDTELVFMTRVTNISRPLGLKVVWYYPSLEVLSPVGADAKQASIFSQHPDWVQYNISANYADPDIQQAFVFPEPPDAPTPTAQRSWMCHLSPYRNFYFDRIRKVAATGVDGIWVDRTLFGDDLVVNVGVPVLACSNPFCRQKFETDTAFSFPTTADTTGPSLAFKRWLIWRHQELAQFLVDLKDAARSANPVIEIIVDTPTLDHNTTVSQALDLTYLTPVDGITAAWEIPLLSTVSGMRNGMPDDWLSFIAMNKFARGTSSQERPGWVFSRGLNTDDAELVMAEGIAAQLNPFDTGIRERTTVNDSTFFSTPQSRARSFSFVDAYKNEIYGSTSTARIALVFSSPSRDFVDLQNGVAAFVTAEAPQANLEWWTNNRLDAVPETNYIAEYRGWVKALVENHVPFDIVPIQNLDAQLAQQYETLILPNPVSLSDAKGHVIDDYVNAGGGLVVTGSTPFLLNEFGIPYLNPLSSRLLAPNPTVFYSQSLPGKQSLQDTLGAQAIQQLIGQLPAVRLIDTDAPPTVHLELFRSGQKYLLHSTNFAALTGDFQPSADTFAVTLQLPEASNANDVTIVSLDNANNLGGTTFSAPAAGQVSFDMPVNLYSLAIVSFDSQPVQPFSAVRLPTAFAVAKNFPNPFQSSTTITVSLNVDTDLSVEIYNIMGQKIRTLANGGRRADTYDMIWDGKDGNGLAVANGIYFCRLRAGIQQHFMRLSLIR